MAEAVYISKPVEFLRQFASRKNENTTFGRECFYDFYVLGCLGILKMAT